LAGGRKGGGKKNAKGSIIRAASQTKGASSGLFLLGGWGYKKMGGRGDVLLFGGEKKTKTQHKEESEVQKAARGEDGLTEKKKKRKEREAEAPGKGENKTNNW